MPKLYNLARMTTATTGTGTITLGVASSGFLTFAGAGVANGDVVFYGIKDGANSEVGYGTYTASGTTLTRSVVKSTNSNAAIALSGAAEAYITAVASDGGDLLPGFSNPLRGFDAPINLQLNASVASNILTVAVKGNNGSDPSNSNPVLIPFRDATIANGDPVWRAVTAALSINTSATGASLGAGSSSTPFRFWVVAFDNAGTVVLALINCVAAGRIFPLDESSPQNTTGVSASAASAGVFYTPNGTALTGKSFRIIGYVEYSSGLATAGTYATAPTKVQLFGPGIRRPGEAIQISQVTTSTETTTSATSPVATALTTSMTLISAVNPVRVNWATGAFMSNAVFGLAQLFRGNAAVTTALGAIYNGDIGSGTNSLFFPISSFFLDVPFASGTTTAAYTVGIWNSAAGGSTTLPKQSPGASGNTAGMMMLEEIMG